MKFKGEFDWEMMGVLFLFGLIFVLIMALGVALMYGLVLTILG